MADGDGTGMAPDTAAVTVAPARGIALASAAFQCRRKVILMLLVLQITVSAILMRYARTSHSVHGGPMFHATEAVLATEVVKMPVCLVLLAIASGGPRQLFQMMYSELPTFNTLKCAVPALAYTVQGNLLFLATANLETPTYQVTYQTKTLFTALFSVLLLGRRLVPLQWAALILLFVGTVLASDLASSGTSAQNAPARESPVLGLFAVFSAALLSSSASVYFEAMLKTDSTLAQSQAASDLAAADAVLWLRNVQLGLFATPLSALATIYQDGRHISRHGMLRGFNSIVWCVVLVNGLGGLLVAATMKYADNIVKCFATALAIISGTIVSVPLFGFHISYTFIIGAGCTVFASTLYAFAPAKSTAAMSDSAASCGQMPSQDVESEVLLQCGVKVHDSPKLLAATGSSSAANDD